MEWISVKERLPEVDTNVIVYSAGFGVKIGRRGIEIANKPRIPKPKTWYLWGSLQKRTDITHWMPLPEPPKE